MKCVKFCKYLGLFEDEYFVTNYVSTGIICKCC